MSFKLGNYTEPEWEVVETNYAPDITLPGAKVEIARNLAKNPGIVVGGGSFPASNDGNMWVSTLGVTPPVPHPLGYSYSMKSISVSTTSPIILSLFKLDGFANTNSPERVLGIWVLITAEGFRADVGDAGWPTDPLPKNKWVYLQGSNVLAPGSWGAITIRSIDGSPAFGHECYVTGVTAVAPPNPIPGVSWGGTISSDPDFTSEWAGTVNNSESVLYGTQVAGYAQMYCRVISSTNGKAPAIRLIPTDVINDSSAQLTIPVGLRGKGTLRGEVQIRKAQTGALYPNRARSTAVFSPEQIAAQPPNEVGSYASITSFSGISSVYYARWYNGASIGNGDVWWSDLGLYEGDYQGPFFNGYTVSDQANIRYRWVTKDGNRVSVMEKIVRPGSAVFESDSIPGFKAILNKWPMLPVDLQVDDLPAADGALYYRSRMDSMEWDFNLELTANTLTELFAKADSISEQLNPKTLGLQDFVPNALEPWVWQGVLSKGVEWKRDKVIWAGDMGTCRMSGSITITTPDPYGYYRGETVTRTTAGNLSLTSRNLVPYYPIIEFRGVLSSSQVLTVGACKITGPLSAAETLVLDFRTLDFFVKNTASGAKLRNVADRFTQFTRLQGVGNLAVPVSISGGTFTQAAATVISRRI